MDYRRLSPVVFLLAAAAFAAAQETEAKDRSAEPALKELLRDMGSLRDVEVWISHFEKDRDGIESREAAIQLWHHEPSVFRGLYASVWGDSGLMISGKDGFLTDLLYVGEPAGLGEPVKTYAEAINRFNMGTSFGVVPFFLDGEASLKTLAPETGEVKMARRAPGRDRVSIVTTGSRFGEITIHARKTAEGWRLTEVVVVPTSTGGRGQFAPPTSVDEVSIRPAKMAGSWFKPESEPGAPMIDLRPKKIDP